jgi:hypothetical protein
MSTSPRLALPLLASGQAQKDVTHNEALLALDQLVQPLVQSRQLAAPPANPAPGQAWIVPAGGSWLQPAASLVQWDGSGWAVLPPRAGLAVFVADEGVMLVADGNGWLAGWPCAGLRVAGRQLLAAPLSSVAPPSGGSVCDVEARAVRAGLLAALAAQGIIAAA